METFSPRAIDPRNLLIWMREALALTTRRLPANVALGLLYAAMGLLPGAVGTYAAVFLCPVWLMLFCLVAEAADHYRPSLAAFSPAELSEKWRRFLPLFGMFLAYIILVLTIGKLFAMFGDFMARHFPLLAQPGPTAKTAAAAKQGIFLALSNINGALGAGLIVQHAYGLALATPLVLFHGLSYEEASKLSREAHAKNWVPLLGATGFLCIATVVLNDIFGGVFIFALLPFSASVFYTAYRDIFLGRMENKPKPAASERLVQAPTV